MDIHVDRREDAPVIHLILFVPNKRQGPVPVNLLICNRDPSNIDPTRKNKSDFWTAEEMIERGYAAAAYHYRDVANDDPTTCFSSGIFAMMGGPDACTDESWGALGAWAWGGSRVMDYFESDPDIDARHCAVTGHSRGGKTALWCGAQDERWAMAVSSCSGCGGATLSRRFLGETVEALVSGPYYWFCRNFRAYAQQVDKLPFDQHMLIALMAPRLVYVSSATEDLWADPRGEWQATWLARPVWRLYGMNGLNGEHMPALAEPDQGEGQAYHIHPGIHTYCLYDWQRNMDFTDRMYRRD